MTVSMANKGNSKKYQETAITCVIIIATVTHRVQLHYKILVLSIEIFRLDVNIDVNIAKTRPAFE